MKRIRITFVLLAVSALALAVGTASAAQRGVSDDKNIVETAVAAGQFGTLVSLAQAAGLGDTLANGGPFTVFAPTDAAFAKVPKATLDALAADPAKLRAVLLYHVVSGAVPASQVVGLDSAKTLNGASVAITASGGSVKVDGATVTATDIRASNGIIHVIDTVLIPKAAPAAPKNIVQTASGAGSFKTLTSLLRRAGLTGALQAKGPFTVFAPTDAAFAKVPKATLAALGKNRAKLRAVLLYHVVKGKVTAKQVVKLRSAKTLNGQSVRIRTAGRTVRIDNARVVTADVAASNGVIHAIDRVLIPR
jgi:transforming growth factor-beta-induced protein